MTEPVPDEVVGPDPEVPELEDQPSRDQLISVRDRALEAVEQYPNGSTPEILMAFIASLINVELESPDTIATWPEAAAFLHSFFPELHWEDPVGDPS